MFQHFRKDAQRQSLHFGDGLIGGCAIYEGTRNFHYLGNPPSVYFLLRLYGECQCNTFSPPP